MHRESERLAGRVMEAMLESWKESTKVDGYQDNIRAKDKGSVLFWL